MADITPDMCSIMSVFKEQSDGALTSCLEGCVWRANTSNEPSGTGTFLEVGQFDQQPVCAHIRLQSAKDKPYLGANLVSLVAITIANGVETAAPLKTASAYQVEYLSPFKHVRSRVQDVDGDCPLKALMLACIVLKGHTADLNLKPRVKFLDSLQSSRRRFGRQGKREATSCVEELTLAAQRYNARIAQRPSRRGD